MANKKKANKVTKAANKSANKATAKVEVKEEEEEVVTVEEAVEEAVVQPEVEENVNELPIEEHIEDGASTDSTSVDSGVIGEDNREDKEEVVTKVRNIRIPRDGLGLNYKLKTLMTEMDYFSRKRPEKGKVYLESLEAYVEYFKSKYGE